MKTLHNHNNLLQTMSRPYVICHMMTSIDGKILSANWGRNASTKAFKSMYETAHESYSPDAWICGRVTMEKDFARGNRSDVKRTNKQVPRTDFIADKCAVSFAIAVDASGKLFWENNQISGDHIIEVLTEKVKDAYLAYLQQKGISYIFAGKEEIDFTVAVRKIGKLFPIRTLMLEGGGHLNGSFLNAGLINELSVMLLPIADGTPKSTTLLEVSDYLKKKPATFLMLHQLQHMEHDVLWLKYKVRKK